LSFGVKVGSDGGVTSEKGKLGWGVYRSGGGSATTDVTALPVSHGARVRVNRNTTNRAGKEGK